MPRIPLVDPQNLTPEQKRVYDAATGLPNREGSLPPPYQFALHCPELTDKWQQLGELVRYRTSLPRRLSELAILITARHWTCQYEWHAHEPCARAGGVSEAVIEAIRAGARPQFASPDEEALYDFVTELQNRRSVSATVHKRLLDVLGVKGIVELVAVLGHYTMIAMTLNANDYGLPSGVAPPLAAVSGER